MARTVHATSAAGGDSSISRRIVAFPLRTRLTPSNQRVLTNATPGPKSISVGVVVGRAKANRRLTNGRYKVTASIVMLARIIHRKQGFGWLAANPLDRPHWNRPPPLRPEKVPTATAWASAAARAKSTIPRSVCVLPAQRAWPCAD